MSDRRVPEYVAVECPVCYTRMHARPAKAPGTIKCPDCYTLARVPSISEVLARLPRARAPEVIGTYDLGSELNPIVEDATPDWPTTGSYGLSAPVADSYDAGPTPAPGVAPATSAGGASGEDQRWSRLSAESRPSRGEPDPAQTAARPAAAPPADADDVKPPPDSSAVACPACGARIEPPASDRPQTILCPECLEDVPVPGRRTAARASARPKPRQDSPPPEPEPRDLAKERTQRPVGKPAKPPAAKPPAESSTEQPRRGTAKARPAPAVPEPDRTPALPPAGAPAEERIEFEAVVYPQPPRGPVNVFEAMAEIRQEAPDPPPRWTFFSSVFGFPWRPDVLMRWIYLAAGFTVFGIVVSGYVLMAEDTGLWLLVLMFFMPPLVAAAGLTLSYSAACFLPILIDTAAGNDRVKSWFDPDWKEWAVQFMYLVCMLFVALLVGHVIGVLADVRGETYGLVLGVTTYVTFPIIVLSSQEANSMFIPLTLPILRSMVTSAWVWLMFYVLSGVLVGAAAVLILLESEVSPYLALMGSGPILATVCLIYPRLLGRLAWRASLTGARRRRRKRRRPVEFPAPAGGIK